MLKTNRKERQKMKKDKRCSFRVVIVVNDLPEQSVKDMEYNAQGYIKDDIENDNLYIEDIIKIDFNN
tara:strand:- start:435 stop:635 length:201 start_codon:yes stop_codon:yes gene_type:complete